MAKYHMLVTFESADETSADAVRTHVLSAQREIPGVAQVMCALTEEWLSDKPGDDEDLPALSNREMTGGPDPSL